MEDLERIAQELNVHFASSGGGPKIPRHLNEDGTYIDGMGRVRTRDRNSVLSTAEMRLHMAELATLLLQGVAIVEACRITGVPYYTARRHYLNHPEFQELLKQAGDEAFARVKGEIISRTVSIQERASALAEESLNKMEELLHTSHNEHIQFKVAQDLLDRDPRVSRTKRIEGTGAPVRVDIKLLILAATAAREIEVSKGTGQGPRSTTSNTSDTINVSNTEGEQT